VTTAATDGGLEMTATGFTWAGGQERASGFNHWDEATLSLVQRDGLIPTLNVVDDTFVKYRDQMAAVIAKAKAWLR